MARATLNYTSSLKQLVRAPLSWRTCDIRTKRQAASDKLDKTDSEKYRRCTLEFAHYNWSVGTVRESESQLYLECSSQLEGQAAESDNKVHLPQIYFLWVELLAPVTRSLVTVSACGRLVASS